MIPTVGVCSRCRAMTNAAGWPFLLSVCIACFREYLRSFEPCTEPERIAT